jgi:hypothetical protein
VTKNNLDTRLRSAENLTARLEGDIMKTSSGSESVRQHLNRFVIATILAVGLLAVAWPAQAKIVYHSADITINDGVYNLDLNGDGVTDFVILSETHTGGIFECPGGAFQETPASGNGVILGSLKSGEEIGPDQAFIGTLDVLAEYNAIFPICSRVHWGGLWVGGVTKGYLGMSFQLNGETYYGWAQLTVPYHKITGTLTGYAYENTPGMPIKAGQTK